MLISPSISANNTPNYLSRYFSSALITLIGIGIIFLAVVSYLTELPLQAIFSWLERVFSLAFVLLFTSLLTLGGYAIMQLKSVEQANYWHEVGQQASNAISTLALTFTLLGISLGIGTLAEQPLTPENVQQMVSGLTKQFSMAFMTTVVGLPAATIIRALIAIKYQKVALLDKY
jgi:hypothetical protein